MKLYRFVSGAFLLASMWNVASAHAQNGASVRPEGSISFLVGIPQGEMHDNVGNPGFGFDLFAGLGFAASPVVVGVEAGFLVYGHEERTETVPNIPEVPLSVETTNNIVQSHLVLRMQPPGGAVRPYIEGLFGFKYLFTQSQIESERWNGNDPIASSTNFDDFALSYGVGGGVAVELYRFTGENKSVRAIELQIGAQYLLGTEAEYLKEGAIRHVADGEIEFDVERSRTTLLEPYLGISLQF